MKREIKFRVWDASGEYFKALEDDGDYYFRDDGDGLTLYDKFGECKNTILVQFTGLKDKNGKEIYEGDIIQMVTSRSYRFGDKGAIEYSEEQAGFIVKGQWSKNQHHERLDCDIAYQVIIIGNVHENPSLTVNL